MLIDFFDKTELRWSKLVGVCTDGAPAMIGANSGLISLVKQKNPAIQGIHCMIQKAAPVSKTIPKRPHEHMSVVSAVALQLRPPPPPPPPPKVSARAPAHRSYHFRGVKLKSCIKKIHHNLYISKQANVRIKHADTEGSSHKKFGTDARVQ